MQIEDHPFFAGLADEQVTTLTSAAETLRFAPGELIFDQGTESTHLYLLLEGTVEFSKRVKDAAYHVVSTSGAGELFGEIGMITDEPRSLRVHATTPVKVAALGKAPFEEFMHSAASPVARSLNGVIRHLHHTTEHYLEEIVRHEKLAVVGTMANTIIHDFKNPFAAIRLGADYLAKRHDDEVSQQICRKILNQIDRMLDMATELNLYSRGKFEPVLETVRLPDLMDRFREVNSLFFDAEGVTIDIDVENTEIEAELNKLLRVLQNLVGNAIDAADDDSVAIRIEGRVRDGFLNLTLADNAGGIPEEIRDRFFEVFVTHGKRGGSGLGTAIVKSIVEAHHGTISFETETGKGTTFTILLPLRQPRPPRE